MLLKHFKRYYFLGHKLYNTTHICGWNTKPVLRIKYKILCEWLEDGCVCDAAQLQCMSDRRRCPGNGKCIPGSYFCDGDNDCGDYSDESSCSEYMYPSLTINIKYPYNMLSKKLLTACSYKHIVADMKLFDWKPSESYIFCKSNFHRPPKQSDVWFAVWNAFTQFIRHAVQ